jgi:predicted ATPase/DNA-binding SARP family transcriptional activator
MTLLTVRLLGPLVVEREGAPVGVTRIKASALVAYLACNPQRQARSHLVSLLWPEVDEARGLASLRNTLWELQRVLGSGWVQTDRTGVQLQAEPEVWVDVQHFQRLLKEASAAGRELPEEKLDALAQAVALYRGRMLEGLTLPDCTAFDEWLSQATEKHHLLATQSLERLATTLTARGRLEEALPHAQRLVALEPTHEEAHRALIRLYGWLGRWADALRQHRHCVEVLREELGVTPEAETSRLLELLKSRTLPPPPAQAPARGAPAPEAQARRSVVLPTPATPLHGRASELSTLVGRLQEPVCRLLTLTGPGGIGKTRLALEAAHQLAGAWRDGVRFVPLAAVDDPARLATALLEALELPASHALPEVQLREHLRAREMLLVLDSLEHLLGATPVLAELLAHAPGLRLLVTSRERLNLRGEWVMPLDRQDERECLELFALLAARADASFQLGPDNEAAVTRICRLVEGSPLGLELAAAWVPFFSPEALAARLEENLDFLAAPRDAPERHQSLRNTFLHSWRLLSPEEQGVLRRLSVFRGGIPLEAAGVVAGASLASLTSLVHKSLLRRTASGRVELHGLLRQYAAEQLRALPEEHHQTHQRHARHFIGLLERLHPQLLGGAARQAEALATFGAEQEDFRAGARWAFQHGQWDVLVQGLDAFCLARQLRGQFHQPFAGLVEMVAALRPVVDVKVAGPLRRLLGRMLLWQARFALDGADCSPGKALALVEEGLLLLGAEGAREDVASGLLTAGRLALRQGNVPTARWCFHGSLSLARASGERLPAALALGELAEVALHQGRPQQARRLLTHSLASLRLLGAERHVAACLGRLATLVHSRGELEQAASLLRQGLGLLESAGLRLQAVPLRAQLAEVLLQQGAVEEARGIHTADLELGRALGHPETVAQALQGLGLVATRLGEAARARELLEEALALRGKIGARRACAESLVALGRLGLSQGDPPRARACLHAALQAATEVGSPPLILDVLGSLTELAPSGGGERLHRAARALVVHPLTSYTTRQRAAALLPPQELPPVADFARPSLPQMVADVLAAVGMD